jgi:hypothetical protein
MFHLEVDVFDGPVPDEGACEELSMAYSQKYLQNGEKPLVGHPGSLYRGRLNPMAHVPLD